MLGSTLKLILDLANRQLPAHAPAGLDDVFAALRAPVPTRPVADLEDDIWDCWIHHPDTACDGWMVQAIAAMAVGHVDDARGCLARIVAMAPDWAEAWNKRATLNYMMGRDIEAVADIGRTIVLEPRHFGAIAGFGHIALRHGDLTAAQAAFEEALRIHPHLNDIRVLAIEIGRDLPHTVN